MKTIIFEDNQQDFLEWDVDTKTGEIIGCRPFQGWLWKGKKLQPNSLRVGCRPVFEDGNHLVHKIIKVKYKGNAS